jgi:hypothetical protein
MAKETPKDYQISRARTKDYLFLRLLFKMIDAYIIPSANPDILAKYIEVRNYLCKMYKRGSSKEKEKDFAFFKNDKSIHE